MSEIIIEQTEYKYAVIIGFNGFNGSIYDAIEYAHVLSTIGKTNLIICNNSKALDSDIYNKILELINKKYILTNLTFDINIIPFKKIHKIKYDSILFMDTTGVLRLPLFFAEKYIILNDYVTFEFTKRLNLMNLPNVYTFNEMPFFPSPVNYKFKFAFDIYKQYDKLEDNTLISNKNMNIKIQHEMKFINNKTKEEIKFNWPIDDFHSKFNRYVYNNNGFFDPRCRLLIECFYYGIKLNDIIRNIKIENYDGAYYRLLDLKENGLENRKLDINDEVIQMMVS